MSKIREVSWKIKAKTKKNKMSFLTSIFVLALFPGIFSNVLVEGNSNDSFER